MLTSWVVTFIVVGCSLLVGRAIAGLAGRERWCGLEPAVGLAALFSLEGLLARLPGGRWTLILGLAALVLASAWAIRRPRREDLPKLPAGLLLTLAVTFLLVNVPFVITGHWGLLGVGYNNDLGLHLAWADWLRSGFGTEPGAGYPLGPHGLAAALSYIPGLNLATVFTGELMAIMLVAAWTAWHAVTRLDGWRRPLAAVLIASPYLMASFYAQAAFKELAAALFLLAFVIWIGQATGLEAGESEAARPPGKRGLLLPLLLVFGIVFTYSFPGLIWPAAVATAAALATPRLREHLKPAGLGRQLGRPVVAVPIAGLVVLVLALVFAGSFGFGKDFTEVVSSDAFGPVSPVEGLGVWLNPDYRLHGDIATPVPGLLGALGIIALLAALWWWFRGPRSIWPAAFLACGLIYLLSVPWMGDYSLAKALVVAAPVTMTVIITALLSGPAASGKRLRPAGSIGWISLAALFIAGAIVSSLLVLRDASVAPGGHAVQLARFQGQIAGKSVLFLDQDRFAQWRLSGARAGVPLAEFPDPDVIENPKKPFQGERGQATIDFDSFSPETFDNFEYAISSAAGWQSATPPFYREVARTPDYILWRRTRPGFGRPIMREGTMPAKLVDCEGEGGRYFRQLDGEAALMPPSVVVNGDEWQPQPSLAAGERAGTGAVLEPGLWRVSLQYFSPGGFRLTAPGYDRGFPAALDGQRLANRDTGSTGQFWPGGILRVKKAGEVRFTVTTKPPSALQRLTGYSRKTELGRLVLMRTGARERVPMDRICDRWVDFFRRQHPVGTESSAGVGSSDAAASGAPAGSGG